VTAARIGHSLAFIGVVGDDQGGRLVCSELEAAEIDVTRLHRLHRRLVASKASLIVPQVSRRSMSTQSHPLG
jgi:sugar/nucleoside kinase (ribokinase family)